jgi:hypothetical protein
MTTTHAPSRSYDRALEAEPGLRALDALVDALCALVRPSDALCHGCVWERIVKPLALPLVGWARRNGSATDDSDRWLRSSEAYDTITNVWLARLQQADPANGHGISSHAK